MRMFENIKFLGLYIQVENDGYNSIKFGRLLRIDESEREMESERKRRKMKKKRKTK